MDEPRIPLEALLGGAVGASERVAAARVWLDRNLRHDPKMARGLIEALLPEALAAGDAPGVAWLRFSLGWLAIDADDYEQGLTVIESARSTFEDLGDREGLSRCLNALGFTSFSLSIYDLALDYFRESAKEAEQLGRRDLAGAASMNMAECLYELGESDEALLVIEHCRQHCEIAPRNIASTHSVGGLIYRSLGRLGEAERELLEAIGTAGDALHDSLEARQILAEVYIDSGRLDQAEALVTTGLKDCVHAGERLIGTRFRLTRARLSMVKNRALEAISDIEAVILAAREIGARKIEADAEKALYLAWQDCGEYQKALAALVCYSGLKDSMKSEQTSRRILGLHDERTRRETRQFELLYKQISTISEIGQRITANLDFDATLETLFDAINALMDAPTLLIALVDEERNSLDYRLVMVRGKRQKPFSYSLDQDTFGCWCVNHRSDILVGDIEAEHHKYVASYDELLFDGTAEKSLVFVPLIVGNKVVGVLSVQSHLTNAYDKRKVETIRAIGSYLVIAIENARLFRQIQQLATIDSLTGLLNRRRLTEVLDETYVKTKRYGRTAGIIMVDVDHFKQVNDTYGHDIGDAVLRTLARVFSEKLRVCDAIGRFGGEEFVILLPETSLEGAGMLAERLRVAIAAQEIPIPGDGHFTVTASFGVSVIRPNDPNHEAVLKRVDQALYQAKQTGRNRVAMETTG
jgi:diguanylate cyclase (GGDEF)-like protein